MTTTRTLRAMLFICATSIALMSGSVNADVRARLSDTRVGEGDSVALTIETDGQGAAAPDLAPLQADFEIGGTSQASQTNVINGRTSQSTSWTVTLTPRERGSLTIPPLAVGADTTEPLTLEVVDASTLPRASLAQHGMQVDISVPDGTYFVQQEIPLTVRAAFASNVRSPSLTVPDVANASVTQKGDDRVSRTTVSGHPVTVVERDYLVKPESSGELRVPPVTLAGTVSDANPRHSPFGGSDPFERMRQRFSMPQFGGSMFGSSMFGNSMFNDMFDTGRRVSARSLPVALTIEARPDDVGGWFLPAKNVVISQSWSPENPTFQVGEAVQRVVQVVALGASKEQLPDLAFGDVDGARIYRDRVDDRTQVTEHGTAAIKQYTLSVLPTRGGAVTLPEIRVDWLDTATGQKTSAVLPAETISVEGVVPAEPVKAATAPRAQDASATERGWEPATVLGGALVAAFLVVGAGTVATRRRKPSARTWSRPVTPKRIAIGNVAAVRRACQRRDAEAAFNALKDWFAAIDAQPDSLTGPAGARMRDALRALESHLYSPTAGAGWDARGLLKAFGDVCAERTIKTNAPRRTGPLPPIYPHAPHA